MTGLMKDLQQMNNSRDQEQALKSISLVICRVLECDYARVWYVNSRSKVAWVSVESKKTGPRVVYKNLVSADKDGLTRSDYVSEAYKSQRSVNIPDAYADPEFDRRLDQATGYRTKAVLCAPIRTEGKVRAVVEAVNKISTSASAFDGFDEFLLHVINWEEP